ncbi:hypothetical protein Mp_1g26060 [Marchantia polymorpha subsp. ruderalis]|uniref:Uncharacterized protein n=2 Tax=Marchantia polymorpha TaxID=3197 RepID=A0AAF6AUE1_MARPO|nr:hypothetical protein MARPO_0002s0270 [Marchantia polymorpha]BBN00062.1 hypothetical protein Mp_1g26060 [Marchantia polymorpha subsp. ruderalis]|eukprot:PTQ49821.1 hypothetical protein MARPO_0002s0270 [Marchantia polymorpha]
MLAAATRILADLIPTRTCQPREATEPVKGGAARHRRYHLPDLVISPRAQPRPKPIRALRRARTGWPTGHQPASQPARLPALLIHCARTTSVARALSRPSPSPFQKSSHSLTHSASDLRPLAGSLAPTALAQVQGGGAGSQSSLRRQWVPGVRDGAPFGVARACGPSESGAKTRRGDRPHQPRRAAGAAAAPSLVQVGLSLLSPQ